MPEMVATAETLLWLVVCRMVSLVEIKEAQLLLLAEMLLKEQEERSASSPV